MDRDERLLKADVVAGEQYDAAVAGAGPGGLAAAIFLRQMGARVVCIEPERFPHARVGESLDWSAPALLKALGLPREQLVRENVGIYKKKIRLFPYGKPEFDGGPHEWFSKPPLGFEVTTLHVDRVALDQRLFERAQAVGVEFIWDRVASVETRGDRVTALQTAGNRRIQATWFVDAAGQARVLAKALNIPKVDYGRRKVCVWTYFNAETHYEGTSFYGEDMAEYLSWIWEIPINASTISVGCIMPAERFQAGRRGGRQAAEILYEELNKYPRFAPLLAEQPDTPMRTCSYRCFVNARVAGPNWVMVGESAALPDPLTGNGVTAAFRHAQDAVEFIRASFQQGEFSARQMRIYDTNVRRMGHAFNYGIETAAYEPVMRRGLGSLVAMSIYTVFAYTINALYSKYHPQSRSKLAVFALLFAFIRLWIDGWTLLGRLILHASRLLPRPQRAGAQSPW